MSITLNPSSDEVKNVILAFVSSLTYAAADSGTNNQHLLRDSITFGLSNALAQEFVPKIVSDFNLQSLFIDPLIASLFQGLLKIFIYGDTAKSEMVLFKSLIAGVSGSALTLHIHNGIKKY